MFLGVHEYKDMLQSEEKISSSILSSRLKKMEDDGLIASIPHPESMRRKLYYLKPMGKDLIYLMTDMVIWATKHLYDFLDIPEDKMQMLKNDPNEFINITLNQIKEWEEEYLPDGNK